MPRSAGALVLAVACSVLLAACGGDKGGAEPSSSPPPVARPSDFPSAKGKTLLDLKRALGPGPVLSPAVSVIEPGRARFTFGLFDRSRKQISAAATAVYTSDVRGGHLSGPYPARYESLAVKPEFQSESVTADPDAAKGVYVADVRFPRAGDYALMGVVRLDDRLVSTDPIAVRVVRDSPIPEVGERPPVIHTPTTRDVGGVEEKIDTRVPPAPDLHAVDFADVLGKRPVVIVFATPALCQSRVCGPVVDITKQVKAEHPDDVAFIHMEIYNDNEIEKGYRPQVSAWHLQTEPWAFVLDRSGRVVARLEGAFSAGELEAAVERAIRR